MTKNLQFLSSAVIERNKQTLGYWFIALLSMLTMGYSYGQKVVFHEDFGNHTTRTPSQNIPQAGGDANLDNTFSTHGGKFYRFADPTEDWDPKETNSTLYQNVISDGYYAIINPDKIYSEIGVDENGNFKWPEGWDQFWRQNAQSLREDKTKDFGAVLAVNGGEVLNQFYRRGIELEAGKKYKFSVWAFANMQNNIAFQFEVQNTLSEGKLGGSKPMSTKVKDTWEEFSWTFSIPQASDCSKLNADTAYIAIALRNAISINGGNDFFIDDIMITELPDDADVDAELICEDFAEYVSPVNPADNTFLFSAPNKNIIDNDVIYVGKENTPTAVILEGENKNATIAPIGNWPEGFELDLETGELIVSPDASLPEHPLEYSLCNLLGVCETAFIYLAEDCSIDGITEVNLMELYTSSIPTGAEIHWYTTSDRQDGTKVVDHTEAGEGTYYAFEFVNGAYTKSVSTISTNVVAQPQCIADVAVVKTVAKDTVYYKDLVEFTIEVTNLELKEAKTYTAIDVVVEDILPGGLVFVSAEATEGSFDKETGEWKLESLRVGEVETLTITVRMEAQKVVENIATVTTRTEDIDKTNNTSSASVSLESVLISNPMIYQRVD
ncbi:carbohydrate binding domain-containing protein [Myroides sp. LJL115]